MRFKECKKAGSCGKDLCLPEFCHEYDPIIQTNADRIRSMSDEELAEFIYSFDGGKAIIIDGYRRYDLSDIRCWLEQPANKED